MGSINWFKLFIWTVLFALSTAPWLSIITVTLEKTRSRDSNPGRRDVKRDRYLCAMPTPQITECFGSLSADTCSSKIIFATGFVCKATPEGETSHSLLTRLMAKLSLFDGNISRLVLGTNLKQVAVGVWH